MIESYSFTHLELQLILAKKKNLIESFEFLKNKDFVFVKLKSSTTQETREKLKEHIQNKYRDVLYVTFTPYDHGLYIRYSP